MIQWTKLQLDTTNFLLNQKAKDTDEAAVFFGETYHAAMKIAADPNKNIVIIKDVDILIDAWKKVFAVMLDSPRDLKSIPYNIIGAAMIKFWTGALVSPLIPALAFFTSTLGLNPPGSNGLTPLKPSLLKFFILLTSVT